MITFAISTLGCKVNTYESEGYIQGLIQLGYKEVDFKEKADIYIINTCAVTNTASAKSRQKINHAHHLNENALICVVGCYVQSAADKVEKMEGVDIVIGSSHKKELPVMIQKALATKEKYNLVEDISKVSAFEALPITKFHNHTRAFLKVQDGCNQFCSYCIIPYTRGRQRYLEMDKAVEISKDLVENGHQEIVLSGIHTGRYGEGSDTNLAKLIKKILTEVTDLKRIRISSIEINEISDELLELMENDERVARHLHIPVQTCNTRILKLMNRPYSIDEFMERISEIRKRLPDISISTDIICGFPQESEEDFKETLENLKKINFSFMHVFPYSKRDGTVAAKMNGHIENKVKKARAKQLIEISETGYDKYKASFVDKKLSVLFETFEEGYLTGHTSNYLQVKVKGSKEYLNTMQNVCIKELKDGILYGEL